MLVLNRKSEQEIVLGGNIRVKVLSVKGNTVRLGIEAPGDVAILRGELEAQSKPDASESIGQKSTNPLSDFPIGECNLGFQSECSS